LYEEFGALVHRFARRFLERSPDLRRVFDSTDFTQDVFLSFFTRVLPHRSFQSPEELAAYLHGMTRTKVLLARRKWVERVKRSLKRTESLNARGDADVELARVVDETSEVDIADQVERAGPIPPSTLRTILQLKAIGYSPAMIARQLDVPISHVLQSLRRVRHLLEKTPVQGLFT
jgi:RNA polymerase sigma factor (sigma-70 family)